MTYYCQECRQPTEPRLWESGAGSACHEAALMVMDDHDPQYGATGLRPLTDSEQEALTTELAEELHAERTPAERAKARVAEGS